MNEEVAFFISLKNLQFSKFWGEIFEYDAFSRKFYYRGTIFTLSIELPRILEIFHSHQFFLSSSFLEKSGDFGSSRLLT